MSEPKYKVGDSVTIDIGWERVVPREVRIAEVRANHGRQGAHRYYGRSDGGGEHGFYEDQILVEGRAHFPRVDWEAPL
jgi:hypothetical protein